MRDTLPVTPSLRLRAVRIDTDAENVAYLARGATACRIDALRAAAKVAITLEADGQSAEPMLAELQNAQPHTAAGGSGTLWVRHSLTVTEWPCAMRT